MTIARVGKALGVMELFTMRILEMLIEMARGLESETASRLRTVVQCVRSWSNLAVIAVMLVLVYGSCVLFLTLPLSSLTGLAVDS